jgi:S-adenosylmethionine:tRNA ribosyltransferase-isomerase
MTSFATDFDYLLPKDLIASFPLERRDESRLMVLHKDSGKIEHERFTVLPTRFKAGDAIVLNETRVIPARIFGRIESGRETEFLLVKFAGDDVIALVRGLKKIRTGSTIVFQNGLTAVFKGREDGMGVLKFNLSGEGLSAWLEENGHVPLPPYIERADEKADKERYQTVFAAKNGSCAAPTAGLHFTAGLLEELEKRGVKNFKVCLHVGPGTFRPIEDLPPGGSLSPEYAEVPEEVYKGLLEIKKNGGRVFTVGTTTTRALESAFLKGGGFSGPTDLFIKPGFKFGMADALVTNFHLPRSSLLALVCAFAGTDRAQAAYETAIKERYRFYSYGDAMLVI